MAVMYIFICENIQDCEIINWERLKQFSETVDELLKINSIGIIIDYNSMLILYSVEN